MCGACWRALAPEARRWGLLSSMDDGRHERMMMSTEVSAEPEINEPQRVGDRSSTTLCRNRIMAQGTP